MSLPDQVKQALAGAWDMTSDIEKLVFFDELDHDWVIWRQRDAGKAGGLRLIVPQHGQHWFEIPSYACADNKNGVSWEYDVEVQHCDHASHAAAKILATHTGLSVVEAFKALRNAPLILGRYYLSAPLQLLRDLEQYKVSVRLIRPNQCGEYRTSTE
jgi:hypothetical protein